MNTKFGNAFLKSINKSSVFGFITFMMICSSSSAVVINFDDLDPDSYSYEGGNPYLTNEYELQGVIFKYSAYLLEWSGTKPPVSTPNYVGGPGFGFEFVGELPNYVSFNLGSSAQMAVFIDVFGPNYTNHLISSGENHGGWPEQEGSPYIPNELFTFYSATGISSVEFSGRGDVFIDDLTYTYTAAVPEPSSVLLFGIGFLSLILSRLRSAISTQNISPSGRLL